ncbi:MAG: lipolytic protein G-D-S-L family [Sphingobacteriaceae bacterium]|nr:MAG: lipolytic protein G-D-S-L family [Sphingobacteriaceae bacterium]
MKKLYLVVVFSIFFISPLLAQKRSVKIIYIGDSITFGAGLDNAFTQAPPVKASEYLRKQPRIDSVEFSNQGHSGYTTFDFLPAGAAFTAAETAAKSISDKAGILIFSIMLGTNDSAVKGTNGAPVSPETYFANLNTIVNQLIEDFPQSKVIINLPLWYSPNTHNGAQYLQAGLNRLQSYSNPIKKLVKTAHNDQVFLGDTAAFNYFKNNYLTRLKPENGHEGVFYLHPNQEGAADLGILWGKAIYAILRKL